MNVLFDGQAFVYQTTGGVSRYFANLVAGLDALPGCSAHVVAPLHRNAHLRAEPSRVVSSTDWGCRRPGAATGCAGLRRARCRRP